MNEIVLASRNPNKIHELRELLSLPDLRVLSTADFPELEEVDEDALTLEGNALKKAHYVAMVTGLPSLADDTGLEVSALNGAPGVYSARYAGEQASYDDNVEKLLSEMENIEQRKAQFRTVVAFVDADKQWMFEGVCRGHISRYRKGVKGFGYDPIFVPDGFEQSFAEMGSKQKNSISHRGLAMKEAVAFLQKWA
ncbi:MAG: RdgB/HAM1 family non-canonical purine NTP pyrophosphatase [Bacteroidetes bacterium]|jgi:XTP/dITP diphosphohydrolase|nr:RdgB/HAM1 family non-canonical purine NTP pyrophosphatase [Balneolaceae bacterium]MBL6916167.1 RdgB/HAM1 family non-canonical purine NTP pyrophosphatase [Balneolaceae bacterium]MDA0735840.1 RdgB/HAM1 family non-canonical purine NTP pyrophosphatase [Bacteroidota bacterium]MDA1125748.1 RdgB/HAM1 family non-canonical purine NTP pyrophosphatase [Bacteroidota bacterium]